MKKFDLVAKRRELDAQRVKDTRETIGTRITKVIVALIGGFMLWSACTTLNLSGLAQMAVNAVILIAMGTYIWKSGALKLK